MKNDGMLSFLIPVCDEEATIRELYEEIKTCCSQNHYMHEIIIIDDGSSDGTAKVVKELCERDPALVLIEFAHRYGKSAALEAGLREARGAYVVTLDGDGQDDPNDVPRMLAQIMQGSDLVCGWRKERHDKFGKVLVSYIFNIVTRCVTGIRLHDFNCGFKMFRRAVADTLSIYGEMHRFIPVLAGAKGFSVSEVAVNHRPRLKGKSKFGLRRYVAGCLDLLTVLFLTRFLQRPAHFFGGLGILCGALGFGVCGYIVYLRVMFGNIQDRFPLLFLGVLLVIVGVQLISVGLLGEMLAYSGRKTDVGYSIKRKTS